MSNCSLWKDSSTVFYANVYEIYANKFIDHISHTGSALLKNKIKSIQS